jgi:hypothetical protein
VLSRVLHQAGRTGEAIDILTPRYQRLAAQTAIASIRKARDLLEQLRCENRKT